MAGPVPRAPGDRPRVESETGRDHRPGELEQPRTPRPSLRLPEDDRRLIATFHYYSPFHFTHQGAEWVEKSNEWKGQTWTGTPGQIKALKHDFAKAAEWGAEHNRPIYLGEFGAAARGLPMSSRVTWTSSVAREAERLGFSWSYWEFAAGFGAFDKEAGRWRGPLKDALVPPEASKTAP